MSALKITLATSFAVTLLNGVLGDHGLGSSSATTSAEDGRDAVVDLPFALPTIVAGLTLLALYGPTSPVGINVAFTKASIVLAMMFVTLPFVVRTVQPVLEGSTRRSSRPAPRSAPRTCVLAA